ncbi:MAG: hypothetical protein VX424_12760 [Actinomycetota bacterium]|nr:hypothetical protein [Actinomycetota bacterium]
MRAPIVLIVAALEQVARERSSAIALPVTAGWAYPLNKIAEIVIGQFAKVLLDAQP